MPFHRFEQIDSKALTPDSSLARGSVVEGEFLNFCLAHKSAGTGSELHYHPHELLIFPLRGLINAIVGKDRRVVGPGTFVHAPAYARHSMKATEEGDLSYLCVKDRSRAVNEIDRLSDSGVPSHAPGGESQAITEGLHDCYYPLIESLTASQVSARRVYWIEGERLAFGLFDVPAGYAEPELVSDREVFIYVVGGNMHARVGAENRDVTPGDVVQIPRGTPYQLDTRSAFVRYAMVCSTPWLEATIDTMTAAAREHARVPHALR